MEFWESAEFDDHEQVLLLSDTRSGLRAVIAIHSTALGPAAGGTRFKQYATAGEAVQDALRLSRAMSYKSALAGLPCGGGKGVIIGDPGEIKTEALLHAYGRFIDRLNGLFSTGGDVGTSSADVDVVRQVCRFVGGRTEHGDPSISTADGYMHGLSAVLEHRFGRGDCQGLRVGIQGLGAVGWGIAERLHAAGARLVVTDVCSDLVSRATERFGAVGVSPADILKADVDVLAPCALGGIITERTASEVRAGAVAGAANNQLATREAGATLSTRGILFAPDFVINAGGIICGMDAYYHAHQRDISELAPLPQRLMTIGSRLREVFARAKHEKRTPEVVAETIGREILGRRE